MGKVNAVVVSSTRDTSSVLLAKVYLSRAVNHKLILSKSSK